MRWLENIIATTKSLVEHRRYLKVPEDNSLPGSRSWRKPKRKWQRDPEAFTRWITSFHPHLYVFYRVQGVHEFKANPKIQVKLSLTPYLLIENTNTPYLVFKEPYTLYAFIHKVEPREDKDWISVFGTVGDPMKVQKFTPLAPVAYDDRIGEILAKVPFPSHIGRITAASDADDTYDVKNGISNLRFHRFHLRFWPEREKCYGIIDRMWDKKDHELSLDLPPVSEMEADDVKENYPFVAAIIKPAKPTKIPSNISPDTVAGLLDDFLNSKTARTPPWKS